MPKLTLFEANRLLRSGVSNVSVATGSLDISVKKTDFNSNGELVYMFNPITSTNDFLVHGTEKLQLLTNGEVIIKGGYSYYDFEHHQGQLLRNIETRIGAAVAGVPYDGNQSLKINFVGASKVNGK